MDQEDGEELGALERLHKEEVDKQVAEDDRESTNDEPNRGPGSAACGTEAVMRKSSRRFKFKEKSSCQHGESKEKEDEEENEDKNGVTYFRTTAFTFNLLFFGVFNLIVFLLL